MERNSPIHSPPPSGDAAVKSFIDPLSSFLQVLYFQPLDWQVGDYVILCMRMGFSDSGASAVYRVCTLSTAYALHMIIAEETVCSQFSKRFSSTLRPRCEASLAMSAITIVYLRDHQMAYCGLDPDQVTVLSRPWPCHLEAGYPLLGLPLGCRCHPHSRVWEELQKVGVFCKLRSGNHPTVNKISWAPPTLRPDLQLFPPTLL